MSESVIEYNQKRLLNKIRDAKDLKNIGFSSLAGQNVALECVNAGYVCVCSIITETILDIKRQKEYVPFTPEDEMCPEQKELTDLYYDLPHYPHQLRQKHFDAYGPRFPKEVVVMKELTELRIEIKLAEINR